MATGPTTWWWLSRSSCCWRRLRSRCWWRSLCGTSSRGPSAGESLSDARSDPAAKSLRSIGRALRNRNYRLFFAGQSISLIGTWLTRVATSWLVYRLTGSALLLGIVGFAGQIPTFFLAPLAGVWVDRWNRHRVLVVTQVLAMIQSALLAGLALAGVINVWHVLA